MSAVAGIEEPLAILGGVVLALFVASRLPVLAARTAIWISERFGGREALYGEGRVADGRLARYGEARTELAPRGKVFVSGELWDAVADSRVAAGDRVEVTALEGLELRVRRAGGHHDEAQRH